VAARRAKQTVNRLPNWGEKKLDATVLGRLDAATLAAGAWIGEIAESLVPGLDLTRE
jgi:hypothetical protein